MTATLLENAKQQFIDINGAPLVNGTVGFYIQATLTPKNTWQDSGKSVLNSNPLTLDSRGQAIIWGEGIYRQIVKDQLGNVIWDQLTASNFSGTFGSQQTVASNTTTDIGAASSNNILVTGTTTITSLGTSASLSNPLYVIQFQSAGLTLTYNGTSLVLPGGVDIVTQANDWAVFEVVNAGLGYWRCVSYDRSNGQALSVAGQQIGLASNITTDLGSIASNLIKITGVNTITSLGSSASTGNPLYFVKFAGILVLTHNGTSLILPGSANITTAANDFAVFEYLGSGNWLCASYTKANGQSVVISTGSLIQVDSYTIHGTSTWSRPAGCNSIIAEVTGAGASGAGAGTSVDNHFMASGGGGAGAYSKGRITSVAASYTVTVGTGGAAPTAGANNGNDGTASSLGTTIVCNPGTKGLAGTDRTAAGSNGSVGAGGNGGTVGTAGNILSIHGAVGGYGVAVVVGTGTNSGAVAGGAGGIGPYGGAPGITASDTKGTVLGGNAGTGPGSGGSGASSWSSGAAANVAGGAGADGCVIIYSYA